MTSRVTRKKRNSLSGECPDEEGIRRFAKWSRQRDFFNVGEPGHLIQPASANDSDLCSWHSLSPLNTEMRGKQSFYLPRILGE
jgi:hypothetical protein